MEEIPGQPQRLQGKVMEQAEGVIKHKGFSPFKHICHHVMKLRQCWFVPMLQASTVEDIPGRPQSL